MKMFGIPEDVRNERYKESGEIEEGDGGKCGSCNWESYSVFMLGNTLKDAIEVFRENHRGLCGTCMCEMIAEKGYKVTPAK